MAEQFMNFILTITFTKVKRCNLNELYLFFKQNYKNVSFGGFLTFLSSFGQTFLISIYVPEILETFQLKEGTFGGIYAAATVTSSVLLLTIGHTVDHKRVKKVTLFTLAGLVGSLILLGISHYHIALLFVALAGLRLGGQGMLSHISQTVMARFYKQNRGKALSIASLGYALGEAFFPICISSFIIWWGYETSAHVSAGFLLICMVVIYFLRLSHFDVPAAEQVRGTLRQTAGNLKEVLADKKFFIIMPANFVLSFSTTTVFFYQYVYVENMGWSVSLYSSFFTAYAVTRFVLSILGGVWVDKYSASTMFRIYLLPLSIGLIPFALMDSIMGALLFLISAGITSGISGTVKSATLAEVYGVKKLGAIRSLFTMFMVLSTALGPLLVGILLNKNVSFSAIMIGLSVFIFLAILNAQRIRGVKHISARKA